MSKHKAQNNNSEVAKAKVYTQEEVDAMIKVATSKAKITKEFSEYFCDNERIALRYRNLSETKKHFEEHTTEKLKAFVVKNENKLLTSKEFHKLLCE